MAPTLSPAEIRVLGSLVEKELATPDGYPLSLAALVAACNQKTSRDPVTALAEDEVRAAVDALAAHGLARERAPAGSRVPKFSHRLDAELSFGLDREARALLCVLMLRGPQTPGELRARTERLRGGATVDVDARLAALRDHERGPWVRELAREPGRRERRWTHLLADEAAPSPDPGSQTPTERPSARAEAAPAPADDRVERLERELARLDAEIDALRARLAAIDGDAPTG